VARRANAASNAAASNVAARSIGIGRGLASILPEHAVEERLRDVPVGLISPNPDQPRKRFDEAALERLAESLKRSGVIQPLVLRPLADGRYELIAGERRWRAAKAAGLTEVPAVLRSEDQSKSLQIAVIENMAREDLNPIEEAHACAALVEQLGLSREEVAGEVGRSRSAVSNLIRLLDLPDQSIAAIESGELSEGHGRALLLAKNQDERRRLTREAIDKGMSVRELERRARGGEPARKLKAVPSADEEAAIGKAEDALYRALGRDVRVSASRGKLRAQIDFEDLDELLQVADRLKRG